MGCAGLGWEVWLDGMEITQFTYFQQVGGLACKPVTSEITYGLERLASYIQEVESVYDLEWSAGVKYGEIFRQPEYEHSKYSFEVSDQDLLLGNFDRFEKEAKRCIDERLVHPAYDYILNAVIPSICWMHVVQSPSLNVLGTSHVSVTWHVK